MKKKLHVQRMFLVVFAVFFSATSFAQSKFRTADDQQKLRQLKQYVETHSLGKGQTSWAVETLKKYESELKDLSSAKVSASLNAPSSHRVDGGPPVNDDCANATLLTEQTSCIPVTGDVAGATTSMLPDSCNTYLSDSALDVWYQFVAVTSNPYITVTGSASFDAVVFLFDACGGSILDCADATANAGAETIVTSSLVPGNTYYIRVYEYGNAVPLTTTFDICVFNAPPPPVNDGCANPTLLTEDASCTPVSGDVAWATESIPSEVCNTFTSATGYDVWYKFTTATSSPSIDVTGSADFDAVVFLLDTCDGSILACSDTSVSGETERITASGLSVGTNYFIRVYDYGSALPATTTFDICVYTTPVGISEADKSSMASIYPNPSTGIFTVQFGSPSEKTTIGIYDMVGRLVQEQTIFHSKQATLNMSSLSAGVYSVKIQNETGSFTQRVILNK